ncbi:hypothetical protein EVAR_54299_1 [Eumeta japonica]|nr:hypothetical protein EVAR_54288_1 [Eumeta japonica]GBP81269.1 hypothetical protein EVAR_54299_1 [Eumeta japonica]
MAHAGAKLFKTVSTIGPNDELLMMDASSSYSTKKKVSCEDDLSNMSRKSKSILKPQNLINKFQKMEILPEQQAEMSSTDEEEDLDTMLEDALKASNLMRSGGKISQNISLQTDDRCYTLKSQGERGVLVAKLDIYPFKKCLNLPKQEWWKHAIMKSTTLIYSETSPVYHTVQSLKKMLVKQVKNTEGFETELKPTVLKTGFHRLRL